MRASGYEQDLWKDALFSADCKLHTFFLFSFCFNPDAAWLVPIIRGNRTGYLQTLVLANSTVVIVTEHVTVKAFFDLNAAHRDGVPHGDAAILHVRCLATLAVISAC